MTSVLWYFAEKVKKSVYTKKNLYKWEVGLRIIPLAWTQDPHEHPKSWYGSALFVEVKSDISASHSSDFKHLISWLFLVLNS